MNVNSPEFLEDPYRFYKERREQSPVLQATELTWSITGYDAMSAILASAAAGRGNVGQAPRPGGDVTLRDVLKQSNPALDILDNWMLFKNPPQHTRLRKLVVREFTPKMISQLEPLMRATMAELIREARTAGANDTFDLVSAIAYPLPVGVICAMIGIPTADRDRFRAWTQDFAVAVQIDFPALSKPVRARLNRSADELTSYFRDLVARKRRERRDDLISRLIAAEDAEDGLSEREILANCVFLLFSGHETTSALIANGINALLHHPDQYELLRSDPSLIPNAIEEFLRYDPPIQMVGRFALDDIVVADQRIAAGDHIYAFLGAAGRDPAANREPDRLDVTRSDIKHLAFARGAHHCLGTGLARLEARVALEEILERLPRLRPAAKGQRRRTWLLRNFDSLPVRF